MKATQCSLDEKGLDERKTKVLYVLRDRATEIKSVKDGYRFTLAKSEENLKLITSLILLETECCPFFAFTLEAPAGSDAISLRISGGEEVKSFISKVFDLKSKPQNRPTRY